MKDDLKVSVLIIDDDELARKANELSVRTLFNQIPPVIEESEDITVMSVGSIDAAFDIMRKHIVHVVLLDKDLGQGHDGKNIDGISHISQFLDIRPSVQVLIVTGHDDTRLAVEAMRLGACGYIVKSSDTHYLGYRNAQILLALKRARIENERAKERLLDKSSNGKYICKSSAMRSIDIQLQTLAEYSSPVLFLGDSGLGKTVAAKRLGQLRAEFLNQKNRPFFNINMANIPSDLADSILFGHERGAFTGADKAKQGLFELANGGDLFLDEIGEASLDIQAKLLKVIEEKEFCRVGGDKTFRSHARVIFATNRDIGEMVRTKKFREDLYARICTFDITLPSLKDRKDDVPYICESIIEELQKEHKHKRFSYTDFPDSLKEYLQRDNIPFNIRGIRNDIERLMIGLKKDNTGRTVFSNWKSVLGLSKRSVFHSKRPVDYLSYSDFENLPTSFLSSKSFPGIKKAKELFEEKVLREAALQCHTKKSMARLLGLAESNTVLKMNKYRILLSKDKRT